MTGSRPLTRPVPSPKGNGSIKGYLVRPLSADTRSETVVLTTLVVDPGASAWNPNHPVRHGFRERGNEHSPQLDDPTRQ